MTKNLTAVTGAVNYGFSQHWERHPQSWQVLGVPHPTPLVALEWGLVFGG